MNAQQRKKLHQQAWQEHVNAVRKGEAPGQIMQKRPEGIVPARNARCFSFYEPDKGGE